MESGSSSSLNRLAFLTVLEIPEVGSCGGMLILNQWGRPVEFHCTAPLTPTRTQEVLFGTTLKSFLFCEQIAAALLEQTKQPPQLILVDRPELLDFHAQTELPLLLISREPQPLPNRVWNGRVSVPRKIEDWEVVAVIPPGEELPVFAAAEDFASQLPLDEPFERIRSAMEEAHAVAR
ncbi:MAG: hypothetical protein ACK49R_07310 [Planctomycetota bacterium]|jgi:hypothetical protein